MLELNSPAFLNQIISERSRSLSQGMEHAIVFLNLFLPDTYMVNDCVSITKIMMMGVKLMTGRFKKNTHIKSKG